MFVDAKKEGCGITRCRGKRAMASFRSWTHLVGSTPKAVWFVLAAILLGTSLRTCQGPCREQQQLCSLHKNFHRPAVPQYPSNIFYSYFVFSPFVFDDLSAAMKSSSSRVELSSSCSSFSIRRLSSSRISKKLTRKSGISASEFCSFSWNVLQIFLRETFWRSKKSFWILWAVQWNAARLQCSHWPSNGIFESKSFYFKETFSASFVILFKCCKFRKQWNLTPVHIWASTL